jgi:hypothetical protein
LIFGILNHGTQRIFHILITQKEKEKEKKKKKKKPLQLRQRILRNLFFKKIARFRQ